MRYLNTPHRSGIRSLKEVSGITRREMRAGLLSFTMVPRINAMGRMGDAAEVVSLFLSDDDDTTMALAERLDRTNTERQRIEEETYQQALHQLKEKGYDRVVVLSDREWHEGVIGIVAARLVEELCRPVFVFSVHGDIAKGSGRSIPALDLYQALSQCSEMLLSFGGHRQAAGVRLKVADLGRFEHAMNAFIMTSLSPEDLIPTLEIGQVFTKYDINTVLWPKRRAEKGLYDILQEKLDNLLALLGREKNSFNLIETLSKDGSQIIYEDNNAVVYKDNWERANGFA